MKTLFNPINLLILLIIIIVFLTNCTSIENELDLLKPGSIEISSSSEETSSSSGENSSSSNEETSSSSGEGSSSSFELSSSSGEALKECTVEFNPNNRFCYDGDVYVKCDGMEYNPTTHICEGDIYFPATCNGVQYNPLERGCCVSSMFIKANQRCESNVIETKCGEKWYNSETQFCCNSVIGTTETQFCQAGTNEVKDLCNSKIYTTMQFCYNSKVENFCGARKVAYNPDLYECRESINANGIYLKNDIFDERQNKTYNAVLIGDQTWMAKNLDYYETDGSECPRKIEDNCTKYGRLYKWALANEVCPTGWHLPNDDEWNVLMNFVGGSSTAGRHLKATRDWNDDGNGLDTYGFAALPGGYNTTSPFSQPNLIGTQGRWWSASEVEESNNAYFRNMSYNGEDAIWDFTNKAQNLFSVRCIQN